MKVKSGVRPPAYSVEQSENETVIRFAENVIEKTIGETKEEQFNVFEYDSYTLTVKSRPGIENDVSANLPQWLENAKQKEYDELAAQIRKKRDELLSECDKDVVIDRLGISIPEKVTASTLLNAVKNIFEQLDSFCNGSMAKYRQSLRDIPQQEGFPYDVKFPVKPNNH